VDEDNIGFDSYSIDVKLKRHIPDVLPIRGKRVRLTYPGIPAFCNRCWRIGHSHWDCQRNKCNWLEFVEDFYNNREVTDDMLGSWVDAVKKYLPSQGGTRKEKTNQFQSNDPKPKVKSKIVVVPAPQVASELPKTPPRLKQSSGGSKTQDKGQVNNQRKPNQARRNQGQGRASNNEPKKASQNKRRGNN
jgi:hypothetical protein